MPIAEIPRPEPGEYAEYFVTYLEKVPEGHILPVLEAQLTERRPIFADLDEAAAGYRYAEGKWSVKEVLGHVTDTERILAHRALCFARGERQSLPGFDENDYVAAAGFDGRSVADLLDEFEQVRATTIRLFRTFDAEQLARRGEASGHPGTARAMAYVLAGHELHHRQVLRERYLPHL